LLSFSSSGSQSRDNQQELGDIRPRETFDYEICIRNSEDAYFPVKMEVDGPLEDYVKLSEMEFVLKPLESHCITVIVSLPDEPPFYGLL